MSRVWEASGKTGIKFKAGNVVSCDVFYEQNPDWWKAWARMGVLAVEMEAAALYMNAAYAGKRALAMCTVSDHLLTGESLDSEARQSSFTEMMEIALQTAIRL
jgi:purine-nucleoside phosphorylase